MEEQWNLAESLQRALSHCSLKTRKLHSHYLLYKRKTFQVNSYVTYMLIIQVAHTICDTSKEKANLNEVAFNTIRTFHVPEATFFLINFHIFCPNMPL